MPQVTVFIRELVKTENKEIAKAKPASPFLSAHFVAWGSVAVASLAATAVGGAGSALGAQMALPFGLAATVGGYLLGNAVPKTLQVRGVEGGSGGREWRDRVEGREWREGVEGEGMRGLLGAWGEARRGKR